MRLLASFLVPALAAAQAQKPLGEQFQDWFNIAKSYIPQAAQTPLDAGAAKVASHQVHELTTNNWEHVIRPQYHEKTKAYGPDNWMVLVTGGNRTCQGKCEHINAEFNKTAAMFSADKDAPHLASLNCDNYAVLCSMWFAGPPGLWYIRFPLQVPGQELETPIHVFPLNLTATSTKTFTTIHKEQKWTQLAPIKSMFHPFDGEMRKYGLQKPVGYVLFLFSMIPSWSIMLAVSFMSRAFMNRRAANPAAAAAAAVAPNTRRGQPSAADLMRERPLGGAPSAAG